MPDTDDGDALEEVEEEWSHRSPRKDMESGTRRISVERTTSTGHRLSRYEGVCGNIHGHNMRWEVELDLSVDEDDPSNMPIDLKEISDLIDDTDHVLILAEDDEALEVDPVWSGVDDDVYPVNYDSEVLGEVIVFPSDPTCEVLAQWMANRIVDLAPVRFVELKLYETDKYGVETVGYPEKDEE